MSDTIPCMRAVQNHVLRSHFLPDPNFSGFDFCDGLPGCPVSWKSIEKVRKVFLSIKKNCNFKGLPPGIGTAIILLENTIFLFFLLIKNPSPSSKMLCPDLDPCLDPCLN